MCQHKSNPIEVVHLFDDTFVDKIDESLGCCATRSIIVIARKYPHATAYIIRYDGKQNQWKRLLAACRNVTTLSETSSTFLAGPRLCPVCHPALPLRFNSNIQQLSRVWHFVATQGAPQLPETGASDTAALEQSSSSRRSRAGAAIQRSITMQEPPQIPETGVSDTAALEQSSSSGRSLAGTAVSGAGEGIP